MPDPSAAPDHEAAQAADAEVAPPPRRRRGLKRWPRWARWTTYAATGLALLLVVVLVAGVLVVRQSFPQAAGEIEVPGLDGAVTVLRDANGIPQVYADTGHDLFYAQGFVQAQDRFYQMDVRRHTSAGRLSEMFGKRTLDVDRTVRTLGWRRVAEQEVSRLAPQTQAYLQAYSDGVNAYIGSHTPAEMSLEYSVLARAGLSGYRVEDWTPADSLAWLKAMAWDLRGNMEDELDRGLLSATRSRADVEQLFPPYPYRRHPPIVDARDAAPPTGATAGGRLARGADRSSPDGDAQAAAAMAQALAGVRTALDRLPALLGDRDATGIGSNGWVVDGAHSTTGKPLLANDPHLGVSLPGVWYPVGLHCRRLDADCDIDVSGFTFAGVPGVLIGHNQEIAWGLTNLEADVTDLYLEQVSGDSYRYDGRQRPLRTREETIRVRGADPVRLTVRSTRHGPLLSDVDDRLGDLAAGGTAGTGTGSGTGAGTAGDDPAGAEYAVALSWTAMTPGRTADAIFAIDRARTWAQFREAAASLEVPAQNLVYADRSGNIGYQAAGRIPIRKNDRRGDYPARGWLPADDWSGRYVPAAAMPSVRNPGDGFVVTANQAVTGPDYPYLLGDSYAYGYRSQRIGALIQRQERLGVADMTQLQLDTRNGFAPTFVPYLLRILMPSQYLAGGQRLLQGWNYRQPPESAAAAYYNAVWRNTLALTFHDELDESVWPDGSSRWFEVMRRLLARPNSSWWDDKTTDGVIEGRDEILREAMTEARHELTRRQARRAVDWTWGHQHRLDLRSTTLGGDGVPAPVRWLFDRGGYEVGGGGAIVDATDWDPRSDGYEVTSAPTMRMVVSLADLDRSRWVGLTGVSGHAFHPHLVDQTELWLEGRTLPWAFSSAAVRRATADTLTLRPAGDG
ncbi:MAG: penicillin acylase family protein [Nocardioidaceae bacterium]